MSKEGDQGSRSEQGEQEQDPKPFYQAYRFKGEQPAGKAYFLLQEAIFSASECDLSVYRFQINRVFQVAVIGEPPPEDLDHNLQAMLSAGEPVPLPAEVLKLLSKRRTQAKSTAPWVEGHYRPGKRFTLQPVYSILYNMLGELQYPGHVI